MDTLRELTPQIFPELSQIIQQNYDDLIAANLALLPVSREEVDFLVMTRNEQKKKIVYVLAPKQETIDYRSQAHFRIESITILKYKPFLNMSSEVYPVTYYSGGVSNEHYTERLGSHRVKQLLKEMSRTTDPSFDRFLGTDDIFMIFKKRFADAELSNPTVLARAETLKYLDNFVNRTLRYPIACQIYLTNCLDLDYATLGELYLAVQEHVKKLE